MRQIPRLFYWVGTDNGRALGFGNNFGFRSTDERRPANSSDAEFGDEQIALVLWLEPDTTVTPNPTSGEAGTRVGPAR